MNRLRSLSLVLGAAALVSCEDTAVQDITGPLPAASIRFLNFALNTPSGGVNFYANDRKMTGVLSTTGQEATSGVVFGGVSAGGLYTGIEPGQYTFTGRIADTTNKNLPISSVTATIEAGKRYSLYQSGVYNTTSKTTDGFIVEDDFPAEIDYARAHVRFVNAIHNSSPMTLYIKNDSVAEMAIGGPVAYKSAGAFVPVTPGLYNLATRTAGSTTDLITRTQVGFSAGRVYTISGRGDITVGGTTATNRRFLDLTTNR